ncbi:MAG: Uma2 family endonuclease, partial [Acidobacteriota bacterium]|nr:Uma2 family endonuclease [Acidobacteriota bacterium]
LGDKLAVYQAIPSLRHYLAVDAESPRMWHWHRVAEGDAWQEETYNDPATVIRLEALGMALAWREVYAGVF